MALESQREQWWTGAALCHRSLEFWPQRLRRKVRGRGLSPPTRAEADAGACTVRKTARDLELLRSPATDLPTGRVNVGGTGECAGRVHGGPLLGSPSLAHSSSCGVVEPAARLCLCGVGPTSALCRTFAFQLLMPPPLAHLQRPSSPSGSNYPTCHPKPPAPLPW